MDTTGNIKFTMEANEDNTLEFLEFDLKLCLAEGKISVDLFAKKMN